ncbi:MAG: hypothetical protein AB7E09_00290 [Candidatus Izemoplasmatales bacterium]|uniref:DUF308 domain-containing protein n=1 Tax=Hujiaoplasma nucleasis TaxID=2725268 RepID=A0A7L6N4M4_9MOLU|nr:hypothetical protein [Hujiaoplasma nucleasis]QLY40511.1 hypothetical protein HF295_06455 [Hujiaoplasma nucleasis]
MAKAKYGYGWLIKWIVAAILLGVGIFMALSDDVVYTVTGITIAIYSLFRVYPLLKSLDKEVLRTINLIEILIGVVLGGVMIYAGVKGVKTDQAETWSKLFRWFLAFFFYLRGIIFFVSTTFFDEKTEVPKFIFHIIAISLGAALVLWDNFDAGTLGWLFLFVSIASAAYLAYDGYGGYGQYRKFSKSLNTKKEKEAQVKYEKDLPKEEIQKEKDLPNQHQEEEEKQEETYIS